MLNLQQLEESLDIALANETSESLVAWLKERDQERAKLFIGVQGYLANLEAIHDKNSKSESLKQFVEIEIPEATKNSIALAA